MFVQYNKYTHETYLIKLLYIYLETLHVEGVLNGFFNNEKKNYNCDIVCYNTVYCIDHCFFIHPSKLHYKSALKFINHKIYETLVQNILKSIY